MGLVLKAAIAPGLGDTWVRERREDSWSTDGLARHRQHVEDAILAVMYWPKHEEMAFNKLQKHALEKSSRAPAASSSAAPTYQPMFASPPKKVPDGSIPPPIQARTYLQPPPYLLARP